MLGYYLFVVELLGELLECTNKECRLINTGIYTDTKNSVKHETLRIKYDDKIYVEFDFDGNHMIYVEYVRLGVHIHKEKYYMNDISELSEIAEQMVIDIERFLNSEKDN